MSVKGHYGRILLKLSGEALCPAGGFGVDSASGAAVARELTGVVEMGVQVAIVVGAGNIIRGRTFAADGRVRRTTADYMGMLATVINAVALRDILEGHKIPACAFSAIPMPTVCEPLICRQVVDQLTAGRVVILAAGTGSPFFTTDTCAALRALEIDAEVLLKATKVDGVYDCDPMKNPKAKRYDRLTYQQVLADRLEVMDLTAISMCMDNQLPIVVFQLSKGGALAAAVRGEKVGTSVGP